VTTSPWRIAVGAGLLAAGVMIGGAPIVHADSDSGASNGSSAAGGGHGTRSDPSAHASEKRRTLHDVSAKLGLGQHKSAPSRIGPTDSIRSAGAALTRSIVGAARLDRTATMPTSRRQQQSAAGALPSPTIAALPLSSVVRRVTEPLAKAVASTGGEVVPASIAAAITTVTTVQSLATDAVVTAIPELAAPIAAVARLLQLPALFVSQLGTSATQWVGGVGVATTPRSAGGETVARLLQIIETGSGTPDAAVPVAVGTPTPPPIAASPIDLTAALGHLPPASTVGPVGPDNAGPDGVSAFLETYGGLVAASLAALLAAAIPGLAGMFIPTAAGARLGYRQAKARMAMRTLRTARSSAMGPIGIVSSGGLVTLRPKSAHVVRARADDLTSDVA
jgi:hypothetical protein